jgi:transposase-like protein
MRQRSSYPKPFKAQVVQECLQPGASVSSGATSHGIGINANVIRKWLPIYREKPVAPLPAFVPLQPMPKRYADEAVAIALPLDRRVAHR